MFRTAKFPWWLLGLAAPFWEMREMRYLYELHRLDRATRQLVLPQFQTTGLAEVAAAQLR